MSGRVQKELEYYKKEVKELEDYLLKCFSVVGQSGLIPISQRDGSLYDWLGTVVNQLKVKEQRQVSAGVTPTHDEEFLAGVDFAYKDCIRTLQELGDDVEHYIPNKKISKYLSTAYRKIGDGLNTRLNIVSDMNHDEINKLKTGGELG